MSISFASIVEEVQRLSVEEKEELRHLLDKYLIEIRRDEIYQHYLESKSAERDGKLFTPKDDDDLRKWLEG